MSAIVFKNLVKKYGKQYAVDHLSAEIRQGKITGFLGPNGAGKSTSLRCLVGLASPTEGETTVLGVPYQELETPLSKVGTVLDSRGFHGGLTGKQNLKIMKGEGLAEVRWPFRLRGFLRGFFVDTCISHCATASSRGTRLLDYFPRPSCRCFPWGRHRLRVGPGPIEEVL